MNMELIEEAPFILKFNIGTRNRSGSSIDAFRVPVPTEKESEAAELPENFTNAKR